jgi:hypothetical protein
LTTRIYFVDCMRALLAAHLSRSHASLEVHYPRGGPSEPGGTSGRDCRGLGFRGFLKRPAP